MRLRPSRQRRWRLHPPSLLRAWVGLWCLRPLWRSLFFLRRWWVRLAVLREEAPSCGFSQLVCGAPSGVFVLCLCGFFGFCKPGWPSPLYLLRASATRLIGKHWNATYASSLLLGSRARARRGVGALAPAPAAHMLASR